MPFTTNQNGLELPIKDQRGNVTKSLPLAGLAKYKAKPNPDNFKKYIARGHHNAQMTWEPSAISKIDVYGWDTETWKQFLKYYFEVRDQADVVYEPSIEDIVPPAYDFYEDLKYPLWVIEMLLEAGEFSEEIALGQSKIDSTERKVRSKKELDTMLKFIEIRKEKEEKEGTAIEGEVIDLEDNKIEESVDKRAEMAAKIEEKAKAVTNKSKGKLKVSTK